MTLLDPTLSELFADLAVEFGEVPMTITDLAAFTAHGERTVRRWIAEREITPVGKVGRAYYYWLSDIQRAERDTRYAQQHKMLPNVG